MEDRVLDIGLITLGDKVVVSDPCYNICTWCSGIINNLFPGVYSCHVIQGIVKDWEDWGVREKELYITHLCSSIKPEDIVEPTNFEVGVDSATAGIFDYDYYEKYHNREKDKEAFEVWYDKYVCDVDEDYKITSDLGVWSRSGLGDGSYECFIHTNSEGKVDGIKIVFIDENNIEREVYE